MKASCLSNSRGIPLARNFAEFAFQIFSISSRVYLKGLSCVEVAVVEAEAWSPGPLPGAGGDGEGAEGGWEMRTEE